MDNSPVMGKLQRITQRRHDGQCLLRREPPRTQNLAKVQTVHKFHEQVIKSSRLTKIINGDDVWMVQCRERLCFTREPFSKLGITHPLRCEEFQCHEAVQAFLPRLIDHAHAAASEAFENFKLW